MTTLREEVELIRRRIAGGDIPDDFPYDEDFVAREYRDAMREDCAAVEKTKRSSGDGGREDDKSPIAQFIYTYKVEVIVDPLSKRICADIPDDFMRMKWNRGVHAVHPLKPESKHLEAAMLYDHNPEVSAHLPIGNAEGFYSYYIEGFKIFFPRDIKRDGVNHVLVKIILPAPSSFGMDDRLPVIPENVIRIRDLVIQRLMYPGKPQDRIADGNPNLRAVNEQPK